MTENVLWQRAKKNFPDLPYQKKDWFIKALQRSCEEELKATMQGLPPPSSRHLRIEQITDPRQCDSGEEFAALKNQYGGFLQDYAAANQPSLRNARIVCLFAGARLGSDEDDRQYLEQFGSRFGLQAVKDYAANTPQYGGKSLVTWAPYGGGNMGQYFNSSFKPDEQGQLQVDAEKTNAFLCPIIVDLADRHGQARKESMLMVIQDRPVAPGQQIKLNYGASYTLEASKPAPPAHPVKREIIEGEPEAGGAAG